MGIGNVQKLKRGNHVRMKEALTTRVGVGSKVGVVRQCDQNNNRPNWPNQSNRKLKQVGITKQPLNINIASKVIATPAIEISGKVA